MADGRSSFGQLYDQYPVTPYPVINAEPTFGAVFRGMTLGDHVQTVVGTAIGATMGFAGGAQRCHNISLHLRARSELAP